VHDHEGDAALDTCSVTPKDMSMYVDLTTFDDVSRKSTKRDEGRRESFRKIGTEGTNGSKEIKDKA
jgi:hypothetical protein